MENGEELLSFIERFEHFEEEVKELKENQKEVLAEAKGRGYDVAVIRRIIAERKKDPEDLAEQEAVYELYKTAIGM